MTEHDHKAIGQAVMDFKQSQDELACARIKAERLCDGMESSIKLIRSVLDGKAVSGGNPLPEAVEHMDAVRGAQRRRDDLLQRLRNLGLGDVLS